MSFKIEKFLASLPQVETSLYDHRIEWDWRENSMDFTLATEDHKLFFLEIRSRYIEEYYIHLRPKSSDDLIKFYQQQLKTFEIFSEGITS